MRVDVASQSPRTGLEKVVANVTARSNQPMPPEKRGSATLVAQCSVEARNIAAHDPEAESVARVPALTTCSRTARTSQLATPVAIEDAQCTSAIDVRLFPRVNSRR